MFDTSLPSVGELAEVSDAVLAEAITGWAAASAAAEARKLAAVAEVARRSETGELRKRQCIDDVDAAAVVVSCALTVSHGKATTLVDMAKMLADRLPMTGARFLAGQISGATIAVIYDRTFLVSGTALPHIDYEIARNAASWGVLSRAKLEQAIDVWIDQYDPDAVRRTRTAMRGRYMNVGARTDAATGTVSVQGRVSAADAAIMAQRLKVMIASVCEDDPRTVDQRRADATGALHAGSSFLACRCDNPDCPAKIDDGRASSIVIHVVADRDSLEATPDPRYHGGTPEAAETQAPKPKSAEPAVEPQPAAVTESEEPGEPEGPKGPKPAAVTEPTKAQTPRRRAALIPGLHGALVPAPLMAELIAHGAKVRVVGAPSFAAEDRYRPSTALAEFVRCRDMTCRFPGCDRPAVYADIDHTVPYPAGATHPANNKCYCGLHHLIKTFLPGWTDRQHPDGTVVITTAAGLSYTTKPLSTLLFPGWNTTTPPPPPPGKTPPARPGRHLMMPTRRRTRAQNRAAYIAAERRLNAAERTQDTENAHADTNTELDTSPTTQNIDACEPPPTTHPPDSYDDDPPPF